MRRSTAAWSALVCGAVGALVMVGAAGAATPAPDPGPADWRPIDADNSLVIDTNQGRIIVELYHQIAPKSAERLETLARQHFYDGLTFFRVIDTFMDQTGDPKNSGEGASSLPNIPGEFTFRRGPATPFGLVTSGAGHEVGFVGVMPVLSNPMAQGQITADGKVVAEPLFCPGVVGIARADDPDSGNSQFFLMRYDHPPLNGHYTAVGRVVSGLDVVRKIKLGEPVPDPQDKMLKVQVLADMPADQRPNVKVIDTTSAYFLALAARTKAERGSDFTACEPDVPAQVN